jgi:hypothetical protein
MTFWTTFTWIFPTILTTTTFFEMAYWATLTRIFFASFATKTFIHGGVTYFAT